MNFYVKMMVKKLITYKVWYDYCPIAVVILQRVIVDFEEIL